MELTAALALLERLRELPRHPDLTIRTDSRYLIDGLEKWLPGWKRKGWRTASGGAVLNRDLWEQLDRARLPGLRLQHVRGHSGDPDNDRCDTIAVAFSRGQLPRLMAGEVVAPAALEAEPAPPALQKLLSRLELAERLAAGGFTLTSVELAQLVEKPVASLEPRSQPWIWRDWRVCPAGRGGWRLERQDGGTAGLAPDA